MEKTQQYFSDQHFKITNLQKFVSVVLKATEVFNVLYTVAQKLMQLLKANEGILMQVLIRFSQGCLHGQDTVVESWNILIVSVMQLISRLAWPVRVLR